MKKIFIILLLSILLISFASAFEFDNIKDYNSKTKTVTVTNAFGFGDTIAEIELKSDLNVLVSVGYQKVAEFEVRSFTDYLTGLKELELYDLTQDSKGIVRDYDYKYKTIKSVDVDDYDTVCVKDGFYINGSAKNSCEVELIGTHKENKVEWIDFKDTSFKKNDVLTIGIFTNVEKGDRVEWIPHMFGERISEWATWTAGLEAGLEAWYNLDEGIGTTATENIFGIRNYELIGGLGWNNTGILRGASGVYDGSNDRMELSANHPEWFNYSYSDEFSVCFWWYPTVLGAAEQHIFSKMLLGDSDGYEILQYGGKIYVEFDATQMYTANILTVGEYQHICVTYNGTTDKNGMGIYRNAVGSYSGTGALPEITNNGNLTIGVDVILVSWTYGWIDEIGIWNRSLEPAEITQLYNSGIGITFPASDNLIVSLATYPNTNLSSGIENLFFNSSATITAGSIKNATLYLWDTTTSIPTLNISIITGDPLTANENLTLTDIVDGNYVWNVMYCGINSTADLVCEFAPNNQTINIDRINPSLVINLPKNPTNFGYVGRNETLNWTVTDTNLESCWYNYNGTNQTVTCSDNESYFDIIFKDINLTFWANDTFGHINETYWGWEYNVFENSHTYNAETIEGATETFIYNFTTPLSISYINLVYNDTSYLATYNNSGNEYLATRQINIPFVDAEINKTFYWEVKLIGADEINSSFANQSVLAISLDNCTAGTELVLNFTLKYEDNNTFIDVDLIPSEVEVEVEIFPLGSSDAITTFSKIYTNHTPQQVCLNENITGSTQYVIDVNARYEATDHVSEFFYLDNGTLNSSFTFDDYTNRHINLMDLASADSTSFLFNFFDLDGLPITDSVVHVFRKYVGEGLFREVERAKQDENGDTIVHLVEEDVIYYFVVTLNGDHQYTSSTYTALCQTTPCTIQLEASGGFSGFGTDFDLITGGSASIITDDVNREVTLTYALSSPSKMNFTLYEMVNTGDFSVVNSTSETATTGTIDLKIPQSAGNVTFFASLEQDDVFIKSQWVDLNPDATAFFGTKMALFIAFMIILTLGLIGITEGSGTIIFVILGVMLSGFLGLIVTTLSTGIGVIMYLILAGGLIIWKIARKD